MLARIDQDLDQRVCNLKSWLWSIQDINELRSSQAHHFNKTQSATKQIKVAAPGIGLIKKVKAAANDLN